MKNKRFKKVLSVFLSVLMIMSCWVFVPGEHNHVSAAYISTNVETSFTLSPEGNRGATDWTRLALTGEGSSGGTSVVLFRFTNANLKQLANVNEIILQFYAYSCSDRLTHKSGTAVDADIYYITKNQAFVSNQGSNKNANVGDSSHNVLGSSYGGTNVQNSAKSYFGLSDATLVGSFEQPAINGNDSANRNGVANIKCDVTNVVKQKAYSGEDLAFIVMLRSAYSCSSSAGWSDIYINSDTITLSGYSGTYGMPSATNQDGTITFNQGGTSVVNYPTKMYMDISEDLADTGYSFKFKSNINAQTIFFPVIWGGQESDKNGNFSNDLSNYNDNLKGQTTIINAFDKYGIKITSPGQYDNYSFSSSNTVLVVKSASSKIGSGVNFYLQGKPKTTGTYNYNFNSYNKNNDPMLFKSGNNTVYSSNSNYTGKVNFTITVYDKSTLNSTIISKTLADSESVKYTDSSWNAYKTALNNAKTVLKTRETTDSDITSAIDNLNAKYSELALKTFTVSFNTPDDVAAVTAKTFKYGDKLGTTLSVPGTRSGYTFVRWYADTVVTNGKYDAGEEVTDSNGEVVDSLKSFAITQDWVLYSQWKPVDVNLENLFSLADWADSNCVIPNDASLGEVKYDLDEGTITVNTTGTEVYTTYGSDSAYYYTMPVEGETEYTFDTEMTLEAGTKGQIFVFFYNSKNEGVTGAIYNGAIQSAPHIGDYPTENGVKGITFTTPSGCTKIGMRVGATDKNTVATYSNIRLYKTSRASDVALDTWHAVVRVNTPKNGAALGTPTRTGYTFEGWYYDEAYTNKVGANDAFTKSTTVYSKWTINKYTITFVDASGAIVAKETLQHGEMPTVPSLNTASGYDKDYHYNYSWPEVSSATADVTYTEIKTDTAHSYKTHTDKDDTYHTDKCSCGYSKDVAHSYNSGEQTSAPSCTTDGVKTYTCSVCNGTKTEAISQTGHTEETIPAVPATCTTPGKTEGKKCSVCGEILVAQTETKALGHTFTEFEATAATCLAPGNVEYKQCTVCNLYFAENAAADSTEGKADTTSFVLEKLGHSYTGEYVWYNKAEPKAHAQKCVNGCDKANPETTACTFKTTTVDPTCTNGGTETHTCTVCNNSYKTYTSASGHDYGAWTYDADGNHKRVCTNDASHVETEACADSATDDNCNCDKCSNLVAHNYGEASCDAPATCKVCKATTGGKLGHSFTNYVSDDNATCTADGTKTAKCDRCDVTDTIADDGSALDHSFTNYVSDGNATCTADGTKTAKCDRCDVTDTIADEGSALDHSFTNYVSNNDATCTEDGTKTAKCDRCDVTDTIADEGSALDHSFTNYVSDGNATCTADGTKTAKCDRCDITDTIADEGSAKGHKDENKDHACDNGCNEYQGTHADSATDSDHVCDYGCGATLEECADGDDNNHNCDICDKENVSDHEWVDATCTAPKTCSVCGATEGSALDHSFTNYVSDGNATCTADGTKTAKCDRCDVTDTIDDEGSALDHSFTNYVSNNDATCTEDGTKTAKCDRCDVTDTIADEGSALDHSFTNYVSDGNATCTADGTKTAKCDRCDATDTVKDDGSAKGHKWQDATCTTPKTCSVCGATEGEALGHSWGDWSLTTAPTATEDGTYTRTCSKNDATETKSVAREDYSAYDEAIKKANDLLENKNLTEAAKTIIQTVIDSEKVKNLDQNLPKDVVEDGKTIVDNNSAETIAESTKVITDAIASLYDENGNFKNEYTNANYDKYNEIRKALENLKGTEDLKSEYVTQIEEALTNNTVAEGLTKADQNTIDTAHENLKKVYDEINGKISDGSALDADDSELKEIIEDLKTVITNNPDLTDDAKKDIQDAIDAAQDIVNKDLSQSAEDLKKLEEAEIVAQAALDKANEKVDYTSYDAAVNAYNGLSDVMTVADKEAVEAIKGQIEAIPEDGLKIVYQTQVNKAAADIAAINGKYGECATGDHVDTDHNHNCDICGTKVSECTDTDTDHDCDICGTTMGAHEDSATDNDHVCDYGCGVTLENCSDADNNHKCDVCDATLSECADNNKDHKCDICGTEMGTHEDSATDNDHVCDYGCGVTLENCSDADNNHKCDVCDATLSECADNDKNHNCDICGTKLSECADNNKNHKCDICGATMGTHKDVDPKDHNCDYCGDKITNCVDTDKNHKCDICGATMGTHEDVDPKDHNCDYCGGKITDCVDTDKNHDCDICGTTMGTHEDSATDTDHVCDYGCGVVLEDCVDADTDHDCDICGTEMGTHADTNNDHNCEYCNGKVTDCLDADTDHDCDICGTPMGAHADSATDSDHVCDYGCGVTLENCTDVDTDTDHDCDICGAENVTSHNYVNPVLTRPTQNADGTWNKGYYTSTCNCGDTSTTDAERANYEAYDKAVADLNALLADENITEAAKAEINKVLADNKIADNYIATAEEQKIVNDAAEALKAELDKYVDAECTHTDCAEKVVAPTCHSLGYTLHVCKNCGYAYRTDEQPATDDHKWGRWFETESGSCLEYRMHERSCLNEGCHEKQIEIMRDANGDALYGKHYVVVIKGQAATCVAPGYTDYERCVVCGEITEAEVIPATGHIDNNKNGNCDVCNYVTNPSIGKCDCLCHNDSFFGKLLYNFVNFFWKLFKIQQGCQCGAQHW